MAADESESGRLEQDLLRTYQELGEEQRKTLGEVAKLMLEGVVELNSDDAGYLFEALPNLYIAHGDLARMIGVTKSVLSYWHTAGFLIPNYETMDTERGRVNRRFGRYDYQSLVKAVRIKRNIDLSYKLMDLERNTGHPTPRGTIRVQKQKKQS